MAKCKLTSNLDNKNCDYTLSGAKALYLANHYRAVTGAAAVAEAIAYTINTDGLVDAIVLPTGEAFYKVGNDDGTISFSDVLQVGGNGGKYRLHTVNALISQLDVDALNNLDALSLGSFVAVVIDAAGRPVILGRVNGLKAPANGVDYNSGAAIADAAGTTLILQGAQPETMKLLTDATLITPIHVDPEIIEDDEEGE